MPDLPGNPGRCARWNPIFLHTWNCDWNRFFFACHLRVTCVSPGCHSRDLKRSLRGLKRSLRRPKRSLRGLKVCVSLACHLRVTFARNCWHFCSLAIRASGLICWVPGRNFLCLLIFEMVIIGYNHIPIKSCCRCPCSEVKAHGKRWKGHEGLDKFLVV